MFTIKDSTKPEINTSQSNALSVKRNENFSQWYYEVIKEADLAENSIVRGCMVISPNGMAIWERIQTIMDRALKDIDYKNAYFPLLIPLKLFLKEAKHVEGFAQECAVVTHYRIKKVDKTEDVVVDKTESVTDLKEKKIEKFDLIPDPDAKLEEPLVIRPTSELIIGETFRQKVQTYRDLPFRRNQWCNVMRWERETKLFNRTSEFLWQEAHTVHDSREDAEKENKIVAIAYREFMENVLAIPVIVGEKSEGERFAGAENSISFEMMMQDRKALQGGTTHYLGQNFAKACEIQFSDKENKKQFAHTTSSGVTTRLIGATVMVHSDDDGLRLPPRIAPIQIVIIPSGVKKDFDIKESELGKYITSISSDLKKHYYHGYPVTVNIDNRQINPGPKSWQAIKEGVPLRIEIGNRELEKKTITIFRRDKDHKEKTIVDCGKVSEYVLKTLDEIQTNYFEQALKFRNENTRTDITTFEELKKFFTPKNEKTPEIHGGFVRAKWCGDPKTEARLKEHKLTIRCLPLDQSKTEGKCILTGEKATIDVIIAKSY